MRNRRPPVKPSETKSRAPALVGARRNGRLRDELLNETLFSTLGEARDLLAAWRDDYNRVRPHSALANRTPDEFNDHHLAIE
jgi:transposase InsO family protein